MPNYRESLDKFTIKGQTFSGTGIIGSNPYDIRGHNRVRIVVENVGVGNTVLVKGRIKGQTNYLTLATITGSTTGTTVNTSVVDELQLDCTVYSASGGTPKLTASGFFNYGGDAWETQEINGGPNPAYTHYVNDSTNYSAADGFYVGIDVSGNAEIKQLENLPIKFYSNGLEAMRIRPNGRVTIGDPDESITFFTTDVQKFLVNGTIANVDNIISLLSVTTANINPSANTNTGSFGFTIYGAQGFNTNLSGNKNFNGGIPVGGLTDPISAIGAFGQVNAFGSGTLDGAAGLLCSISHGGYGCAANNLYGGVFAVNTSDDAALGAATGSVSNAVGGFFTVSIDVNGVSITSASSSQFKEPYTFGPGVITNKTAAWIDGTLSISRTEIGSASSITNMAVESSFIKLTGSTATTLHGMRADTYQKFMFLYNSTGQNLTIKHQSVTEPTAANRIITMTGADIVSTGDSSALFAYDTNQLRWICLFATA